MDNNLLQYKNTIVQTGYYGRIEESLSKSTLFNSEKFESLQDKFILFNTNTNTIFMDSLPRRKPKNLFDTSSLDSNTIVLFKLLPTQLDEKVIERIKSRGLRDQIPSYVDIINRARNRNKGNTSNLKVGFKLPGIVLSNQDGKIATYRVKNNMTLDYAYYFPNGSSCRNEIQDFSIPVLSCFSIGERDGLSKFTRYNILRALVGKEPIALAPKVKITKELLNFLWEVSIFLIYNSLMTYNHTVEYIVMPSSTGQLSKAMRNILIRYFPDSKIITIKKPSKRQILEKYKQNSYKYDKLYSDFVLPSYQRLGLTGFQGTLFRDSSGSELNIYKEADQYDGRERADMLVPKISQIKGYFHRLVINELMKDTIKDDIKSELSIIQGDVLVIDDDLITGSTLKGFIHPILKDNVANSNFFYFTIFSGNSDNISGIDYLPKIEYHKETKK